MRRITGYVWMPLHFGCFHGRALSPDGPVPFSSLSEASEAGHRATRDDGDQDWEGPDGVETYWIELSFPEGDRELDVLEKRHSLVLVGAHETSPGSGCLIGPSGMFAATNGRTFNAPLEYFGENQRRRFWGLRRARRAQAALSVWDPWWSTRVAQLRFRRILSDACIELAEARERRRAGRIELQNARDRSKAERETERAFLI